jgi:hypothetical protein
MSAASNSVKKVVFVYAEAGGGHRAAALSLKKVLEGRASGLQILLADLQEILFSVDFVRLLTGVPVKDIYNRMLRTGLTVGMRELLRIGQALIRLRHPAFVRLLEAYWRGVQPSLAVSFLPNFNRALREGLRMACPGVPYVTVMTDLADYPPHFWIERQDQDLVCGTPRAVHQAMSLGIPKEKIWLASGMILDPRFHEPVGWDRERERQRRGLAPDRPTGLVFFGGQGSPAMRGIVDRLDRCGLSIQLILLFGHNEVLARRLRGRARRIPTLVQGFTNDVPFFMSLSDFFVGKPGPGSISEALAMGLPLIVELNARTLPQERYNAEWVLEKGTGIVLPSFRRIVPAVEELIEPRRYASFKAAVTRTGNRAVFEVADILERLLAG